MEKKTIKAIKIMRDNLHKDLIQLEKEMKQKQKDLFNANRFHKTA
ncbi:hypothetical protein LCGC14_2917730 [marine sediment metagenome]|uniref:Uncharacterized protein n=1 Tax=marine sediment metagenome TaxID=412755 RepID=A0A0F8XPY9_9ZZZZ